jgi:hypothetical protein
MDLVFGKDLILLILWNMRNGEYGMSLGVSIADNYGKH